MILLIFNSWHKFLILLNRVYSKFLRIISSIYARIFLYIWTASVGQNLEVRGVLRIKNFGKIKIGNNVRFKSGFAENPVGGNRRLSLWTFSGGVIDIKNNAGISNSTLVARNLIVIGEGSNIGGGTEIYDNDFHSIGASNSEIKSLPIYIGKNCFIGGHTIILKGVSIGDESVVGAGSVVTKNIPPRELWAGNPAKFIRTL